MRRSIAPAIWLLAVLLFTNTGIAGSNRTWQRPSIVPGQHRVTVTADAAGRSPRFALSCWNGKAELGLRLVGTPVGSTMLDTTESKAVWRTSGMQVEYYEIEPSPLVPDGGYEYDVHLEAKPASNILRFALDLTNADCFYQGPLSEWERQHGALRPENVVGSYAVYGRKSGNVGSRHYGAGKLCHIYRPRIVDAQGKQTWGQLAINNNVLTVTIPQDFLDQAVYPIRHAAGLTFGKTTVGGTEGPGWLDDWPLHVWAISTPSSNGTLTSISLYTKKVTGSPGLAVALYTDDAGAPDALLAGVESGTAAGAAAGWVTTNLSYGSITSGTQYQLGVKADTASTAMSFWYDNVGTAEAHYDGTGPGAPWTNPATWDKTLNMRISCYATYTPASKGRSQVIIISSIHWLIVPAFIAALIVGLRTRKEPRRLMKERKQRPQGGAPPSPPDGTRSTICSVYISETNMSTRAIIIQAQQAVYDEMRIEFETMGKGGQYSRRQKSYALKLIDEYGVRATARILEIPRRTLQRWCRRQGKYVRRCPDWVYSWAAKRRKRREFWARRGYS